jgi:hypothetical protein
MLKQPDDTKTDESEIKSLLSSLVETIEKSEKKEKVRTINIDTSTFRKNSSKNSYNIYENVSVIDDKFLPPFDISLPDAMIKMKNDPSCVPFDAYLQRWNNLKELYNRRNKIIVAEMPKVDDSLLPPFDLTLPIAMVKIRKNPKCVPFELYVKRWNECKTLLKHKKTKF